MLTFFLIHRAMIKQILVHYCGFQFIHDKDSVVKKPFIFDNFMSKQGKNTRRIEIFVQCSHYYKPCTANQYCILDNRAGMTLNFGLDGLIWGEASTYLISIFR